MRGASFPVHAGLASRSRVAAGRQSTATAALAILVTAGAAAAVCVVCVDLKLRIPGHAILRAVFPMAIGFALAPRRQGGTVMGISAVATALLLSGVGGFKLGTGSLTSLALIGPCLDVCLRRIGTGWKLYGAFAAAGLVCNLGALTIRAATKFGGLDALTARPFATWWLQAVGTYTACGIVAGLVSAAVWFRLSSKGQGSAHEARPDA